MNALKTILATATSFTSALGLRPIWSTKNTEGQPATLGKQAEEIINGNFLTLETEVAKKADEIKIVGGKTLLVVRTEGGVIPEPDLSFATKITDAIAIERTLDNDGKIISFVDKKGKSIFPKQILPNSVLNRFLSTFTDQLNNLLLTFNNKGKLLLPGQIIPEITHDRFNLFRVVDQLGNILFIIRKDGTVIPSKMELPRTLWHEIESLVKSKITNLKSDFTNLAHQKPMPTSLVRMDIDGDLTGMTKEIPKKVKVRLLGEYMNADATVQGSSSAIYINQNIAFDFYDENGNSFPLKIGSMISQDSYHLKVYYIDKFLFLDVYSMRLWSEMRNTKPYGMQFPWQTQADETFGSTSSKILDNLDDGAKAVPDGFPVKVYKNGNPSGLGVFRLKKHRNNYRMKKDDINDVHFELSSHTVIGSPQVPWDTMEIRNPKGYTVGVEPPIGDPVRDKIEGIWTWARTLTDNIFLSEYKNRIIIDFWIDWMLWLDYLYAADCTAKNTQWCFYNDKIVPFPYDGDTIKGMYWDGTHISAPPTKELSLIQPISAMITKHFKTLVDNRYKELRDLKIFDAKSDTDKFQEWTKLIGKEAFEEHYALWPEIPSNRPNGTYNQPPYTGGFYASIGWIRDWTTARIAHMDVKYNYNN